MFSRRKHACSVPRKPFFQAVYSPSFKITFCWPLSNLLLTPNECRTSKIHSLLISEALRRSVRKLLTHSTSTIYNDRKNSPPNVSISAGKPAKPPSIAVTFFMQCARQLLGQHINSCSRVIHSGFWPIKSSLLTVFWNVNESQKIKPLARRFPPCGCELHFRSN